MGAGCPKLSVILFLYVLALQISDEDFTTDFPETGSTASMAESRPMEDTSEEEEMSDWDEIEDGVAGLLKGTRAATKNYKIVLPKKGAVNIIDKTAGVLSRQGKPRGDWVVRLDTPHRGYDFNHININPKAIGGMRDPHLPIPPAGMKAAQKTATVLKKANKVLVPVAIAMDAYHIGMNIVDDVKNDSTRNTVEAVAGVAGGWAGGYGGAAAGATIGTAICPGLGTLIGGIVGGLTGGIGGSIGAEKVAKEIGDAAEYGIEERECKVCGKKFKFRKYKGEKHRRCPSCCRKKSPRPA